MTAQSAEQDFERWRRHQDAAALGSVFDQIAPGLLIVAGHVAGRSHAEDLLQATFLHVIEHAERWDGERPLRPWMVGILVRLARRQLQRERRSVDPTRLSEETAVADPIELAAQQETAQRISAAVDGLPRDYRRTLTLRFAHGLTPTEIAHADGEPLATVKSRLRRGLDLLRRSLPAGSQTLALGILTPRGLEAVRREVMARAAEHAAGTVVGGAVVAAGIGTGAVIVMAEDRDLFALATNLVRFFRNESCGKCVPCRVGSEKAVALMRAVLSNKSRLKPSSTDCAVSMPRPGSPISNVPVASCTPLENSSATSGARSVCWPVSRATMPSGNS